MTRAASALLVSFLLPLGAAAAPKRRTVSAPTTSAVDSQAFDQTAEFIVLEAGRAYLKGEAMPDPAVLDPMMGSLHDPELAKAKERKRRIEGLLSNAECVQQGPAGLSADAFKLAVDQAADDLDAGSIVEQEFVPNARAGRSLDAAEKELVKVCQASARDKAYARRSFYKVCLGRKRAEDVYMGAGRASPAEGSNQACGGILMAASAAHAQVPPALVRGVDQSLARTQAGLLSGMKTGGDSVVAGGGGSFSPTPSKAGPSGGSGKPAPPAVGLKTTQPPPMTAADLGAGARLARVAKADEIGFTGYCYSYVKSAMQKLGIVDRDTLGRAGAGTHAKQFAEFVDKNPGLLKRKLRRVASPSWPLPIGTIVVWSPGACNYNLKSGHIEIVTRLKPPQACSDGCGTFQIACLEELSADPARAARELPAARDEVVKAQEEADALQGSKDKKAVRAAQAVLQRKKAVAAKTEARLEPRVAAYLIERQ